MKNKSIKTVAEFLLPVVVQSAAGIIPSVLYTAQMNDIAVFVLTAVICVAGSFLCGFSVLGKAGKKGMFLALVLAELSIPLWILAMFLESGVLSVIMSYSSYFFIFLVTSGEIIASNVFSSILTFTLSILLPALFIFLGYRLRMKHGKTA